MNAGGRAAEKHSSVPPGSAALTKKKNIDGIDKRQATGGKMKNDSLTVERQGLRYRSETRAEHNIAPLRNRDNSMAPDDLNLLQDDEILAAYLVREPHVAPMMRILLEMNDEQRRLSLAVMQCVATGGFINRL